jgi:hypothetical protein
MTIQEMILAGLRTKFPGVDDATLQRISVKKAEGVTDEGKVNSIVEGVSFSDVVNNYGDFRANGASETSRRNAIADYEKAHNLKDGKPIEKTDPKPDPVPVPDPKPGDNQPTDVAKLVAAAVNEAMKPFVDKIGQFEAANAAKMRSEQIKAMATKFGIPDSYAKRLSIPDDADLEKYFTDTKQDMINEGFQFAKSPDEAGGKPKDEIDSILEGVNKTTEAIKVKNETK